MKNRFYLYAVRLLKLKIMRVNIIAPKYLSDQHLIAEYREMKMTTYYYVRSKNSKAGIDKSRISATYTLNKGHGYMWYDKMGYIAMRFEALCNEMRNRNFKCDYTELNFTDVDKEAFGNYTVTQKDIRINLDRVLVRIEKQPEFYKFHGEKKTMEEWREFYESLFEKGELIENYS